MKDYHHLMRTKVPKRFYERLEEIAQEMTEDIGRRIYVSDIVRAAIKDWVLDYDCLVRLNEDESAFEEPAASS